MPTNYFAPGVYIEEKPGGSRPIQVTGTSITAFVGFTKTRPRDSMTGEPITQPYFVANWTQFEQEFGDENGCFVPDFFLPYSVYGYFLNGGSACYIVSLATLDDARGAGTGYTAHGIIKANAGTGVLDLSLRFGGAPAQNVTIEIGDATPSEGVGEDQFKVTVKMPGQKDQVFDHLSMNKGKNNAAQVLARAAHLQVKELDNPGTAVERRPKNGSYILTTEQNTTELASAKTFEGNASKRTGFGGLEEISEITTLVCPDLMNGYNSGKLSADKMNDIAMVQSAMLTHCATMKGRFAILDAPPGLSPQEIREWRSQAANYPKTDSKYGALYYPWIEVANPDRRNGGKRTMYIPPSGHIAGVYARVDAERGVHKAPANESIRGAVGLERRLIDSEQYILNPNGINCIRAFPGRGILVWGARTLAPADEIDWIYINVRRLFNFIEESIYEGTRWVVFEPNDADLWERLKRSITAFLTRVWRDGALYGTTPEEAFYVKCDAELNPPTVRDQGLIIVEVGLAPVKPSEFIVFRFSQTSSGIDITEE